MKPSSAPRTLASHPEHAVALLAVLLPVARPAPEEPARAGAVGVCGRPGRRGRRHAAARAERLPAAGRLLADEAGARRADPHRRRRRGGVVLGGGAGGAADGRRAALRLAGHAGRAHQAHRDRDDVLLRDAAGVLRRRRRRAARRRGVLHLDRTDQRLHRVAVLAVRERPLHRRPGAPAVSVDRRRPVAGRLGRRGGGGAARRGARTTRRTR